MTYGSDANQELCRAIYQQNYAEAQQALAHGTNANIPCKPYGFPLHYTIQELYPFQFVHLLLQYEIDVNIKDHQGRTALHIATRNQHIETSMQFTTYLVEHGADIHAADNLGRTPLHTAANTDVVEYLIAQGAHVNTKDTYGWTPLHEAVFRERGEIVNILLQHGADVNATLVKHFEWTPLNIAMFFDYHDIVEYLLQYGAVKMDALPLSRVQLQQIFRQARNEGNYAFMSLAVNHLAKLGIIQCGMTVEDVELILGPEDRWTGIYCAGGTSAGYGNEDPDSAHNYRSFYWLHYRQSDWMSENPQEPYTLIYWDMGDYEECSGS